MTLEQLEQQVSAVADANGAATFTFAPVPQNLGWRGNVRIQGAPFQATHQAIIGAGTGAGDDWGEWQGPLFYGPVQAISNRTLQIISAGLRPGATYYATWLGISDDIDALPPAQPAPAPAQSQGFSAGTFLDETITAASFVTPTFPCSNVPGARYSITNNGPAAAIVSVGWYTLEGVPIATREIIVPTLSHAYFTHPHLGDLVQLVGSQVGGGNLNLTIVAAHQDSDRIVWNGITDGLVPDSLISQVGILLPPGTITYDSQTVFAGPAHLGVIVPGGSTFDTQVQAMDGLGVWHPILRTNQLLSGGPGANVPCIIPPTPIRIQHTNTTGGNATTTLALIADSWRG